MIITEMMRTKFILAQKGNPHVTYETQRDTFLIGRADECEIKINDPHISRIQAKVSLQNNAYLIENRGRNQILINNIPVNSQFLSAGDAITMGTTELLFQPGQNRDVQNRFSDFEDKTVAMASSIDHALGPKIVLSTLVGEDKIYPLDMNDLVLGRSVDAHVMLEDSTVSRKHCVIENRDGVYYAVNLSETNPILVNDEQVSEKQLYSGDQIRIGSFSLAFISDRPEDAKPVEEKIITRKKGPAWALWLAAACLLIILGTYVFYSVAYTPWRIGQTLSSVSREIRVGKFLPAKNRLINLLKSDLTPEQTQKAMELLSEVTLAVTQELWQAGKLQEAKTYLIQYLADYGSSETAGALWDKLDFFRINLAQQFEANKDYQSALSYYAAVREDGLYFTEAQKAIKRIWLAYQHQERLNQTVSQLIEEAEAHFRAKRYLTPMNQNAYSAYQAVLSLDPENSLALERIDEIKNYYSDLGDKYFAQKNWLKALTYFERYSLIDSESPEIHEKIGLCKQKLEMAKIETPKAGPRNVTPEEKTDEQRDKIKRMLEESDTDSSWIMKYLFEEQSGEKDSEKPW